MNISRRALSLTGFGVVLAGAVLAACSDSSDPLGPSRPETPKPGDLGLFAVECEASVATGDVTCGKPAGDGGARAVIVGNQGVYVTLTSTGQQVVDVADPAVPDTFAFYVTVKNQIHQAMGVNPDGTPSADGVRVFFYTGPTAVPSGTADVANAEDPEIFLGSSQPYFRYPQVLEHDSISEKKLWKLAYSPGALGTTNLRFTVYVDAAVRFPLGHVELTPKADTLAPGQTVQLAGTARNVVGLVLPAPQQVLAYSSSDEAVATVDAVSGLVTAVAKGTATITATNGVQSGTVQVVVNNAPAAVDDVIDALGNVTIPVDAAQGVLVNDTDSDVSGGGGLSVVAGTFPTARGGSVTLAADGSLTYLGPAGFEAGYDSVQYTVTDGTELAQAWLKVNVGQRVWYVRPGAAAPGNGTDAAPFNALTGVDTIAGADETVYVLGGGSTPAADNGITLKAGQSLIGQAVADTIKTMLNGRSVAVLVPGAAPLAQRTTPGAAVTLGTNNTVMGLRIASSAGAALTGTGFGTLTADSVSLEATGGPALNLATGTASARFTGLSSSGSTTAGVGLNAVDGTIIAKSGSLDATFGVSGGNVAVTYDGSLSETDAALVSVKGGHSGSLAFGGALSATGGTGMDFADADGTYNFTGAVTLNGGDAGVDVLAGSSGTFALGSGVAITSPTGAAVSVTGGSADLTFNGNITQANGAELLRVSGGHSGDLVFAGGALSASNGTGLQFDNADGTYTFDGTTTLASSVPGGDAAVDVVNGSDGVFTFAAGASITNPAGVALNVMGGTPALVFAGTISTNASRPVVVDGITADSVVVSGNITSTGSGILVQNNAAGARIAFTGASKSLSTGANPGVAILTDAASVRFGGGGLSITTAGGRGFHVQDAGTVQVRGDNNTVSSTGAAAVYIMSASSGTDGITFRSVSGSGAANAIVLNSLSGTGFQVTGSGTAGSGGTLSATNTAVVVSVADSTRLRRVVVNAPVGVNGSSFGALRLDTASVTSTAGKALGLTTGRLYLSAVALSSTGGAALDANAVTLNGALSSLSATTAAGNGVLLTSALGGLTADAGTITVNTGGSAAIAVTGPTGVGFTYNGNVTQNANAALLDVSGGHSGTLAFGTGTLTGVHGSGLQFNNADGTYSFAGTLNLSNTTGGADAGIDVTSGSGGTFTFASTSTITNPAGEAVRVANSSPSFTYEGAITKTNGSTGITVTGSTGTVAFNSIAGRVRTITSGATNPAVNLTGNSGGTISFGGGNLAISSDDGNAFNATGGGTVNVTGLTNTLSSTGGIALNVNGTTVGASGLTFRSISANGGASGIALNNTGSGAVNVVGNGGVCTLATPTCSGGTIQNTTGDGVSLNTVARLRLDLVRLLNTGGHGIAGTNASGLTVANSLVQGAGDADNETGLFFATVNASNLIGTDSILESVISAPSDVGAWIQNYGGTLNLVVRGSTFTGTKIGTPGVVTGDDLFRLIADRAAGSSTITAKFTGNTFDQSESDGIAALAQSSTGSGGGTLNLTVDGNTFTGDNGGASCASGCNDNGIVAWGAQGATVRFTIQNNNVVNQRNEAIGVRADNTANVQGTIQNNTIGTVTASSGSVTAQGIFLNSDDNADLVVRVHNNIVRSTFWQGIWANAADGGGGTPKMDVSITSNTTPTPHDNGGTYLPSIDIQGTTNASVCAKVESNTAQVGRPSANPAGSIDILQFNTATFRIEGLPSPTTDASAYMAGKNPASSAPVYAFAAGAGSTFTNATCRTPAATPSL